MKIFLLTFFATKGLPRTRDTSYGARIVNATSLKEAEEKLEKYMRKHYMPHGWDWSIEGEEISKKRMENLLKGTITNIL